MMGGIGIALGNGSRNKGEAKDRKRRQTKAESKATNQVLTVENPPREPAEFCFLWSMAVAMFHLMKCLHIKKLTHTHTRARPASHHKTMSRNSN